MAVREKENTNIKLIFTMLLLFITLTLQVITNKSLNETSILLGISETIAFLSYIELVRKPIISILLLFSSQWCIIILDLISGLGIRQALSNNGAFETYIWFIIPLFIIVTARYLKQDKKLMRQKRNFRNKIIKVINYDREVIDLPVWLQLTIWFLIVSYIFKIANNENLDLNLGDNPTVQFKVYSAAVILLPTIVIIVRYTTTNLIYQFIAIQEILRAYALVQLGKTKELEAVQVVSYILELTVYIYGLSLYIKDIRDNKVKKAKSR